MRVSSASLTLPTAQPPEIPLPENFFHVVVSLQNYNSWQLLMYTALRSAPAVMFIMQVFIEYE